MPEKRNNTDNASLYSDNIRSALRANFWLHVCDGSFYFCALTFVSRENVIPVFIDKLGGSNVLVGMVPVIFIGGIFFPQIFISRFAEGLSRKKPLVLILAVIMRIPWLLLGLFCVVYARSDPGIILVFTMMVLAVGSVATGLTFPVWFSMVIATVPVRLRGRMFSLRTTFGHIFGVAAGFGVGAILKFVSFPISYSLLFFIAFALMMASFICISFINEPYDPHVERRLSRKEYFRKIPSILRTQPNFRRFIISKAFIVLAFSIPVFFPVYAIRKFGLDDSYAGIFTIITVAFFGIISFPMGMLADKKGHKLNLVLGLIFSSLGCIWAMWATGVLAYYCVFACAAFVAAVRFVSLDNFVVELCDSRDRPTYLALSNLITAPVAFITLAMGWIADVKGYKWLFLGGALLMATGCIYTWVMLQEPRNDK